MTDLLAAVPQAIHGATPEPNAITDAHALMPPSCGTRGKTYFCRDQYVYETRQKEAELISRGKMRFAARSFWISASKHLGFVPTDPAGPGRSGCQVDVLTGKGRSRAAGGDKAASRK